MIAAVLLAGCTVHRMPRIESILTQGPAHSLHLDTGTASLRYCDSRGPRQLDLASGKESAAPFSCPPADEANTACTGISDQIAVRTPPGSPSDMVDIGGYSFDIEGKVHDCTAVGNRILIATASEVLLLDGANRSRVQVHAGGADRVAGSSTWVVWAKDSTIGWREIQPYIPAR